jgi:hypothetical protein
MAQDNAMTSLRPNPYKVLLLSQDRPAPTSNQSMLIRRYRLARLRPESRINSLSTRVEQVRRAGR